MAIRYKVVRNRTSLFTNGKYLLAYLPGNIVTAPEGTLGIMTFKTRRQAEDFSFKSDAEIIRVRGIGRGKVPAKVCNGTREFALDAFYFGGVIGKSAPPDGTICYQSIEVLS